MSAPESVFRVRIRRRLVEDLYKMHQVASARVQFSFENFLGQILECAIVDFRKMRYPPSLDVCPGARFTVENNHNRRLSDSEIEELLRMYETNLYSQDSLARRFCCSPTTISRIIQRHRAQEEAADDDE